MEEPKTTYSKQGGKYVKGYKGSQVGKDYATSAEAQEEADWQAYKAEKKLSFAASRTQHAAPFAEWRRLRTVKPKPKPSPTPPISTSEAADALERRP